MTAEDGENSRPIEFAGIRFGRDEIVEMDGEQVMVKVARSEIQRIAVRHGFYSAHPIVQAVTGFVLLAVGVLPTMHLAHWLLHGGTFFGPEAFAVAFMFLGPWLIYDATKRGPYLEVQLIHGRKKLMLDRKTDPADLEGFLSVVEGRFGYAIQRDPRSVIAMETD